MIHFRGSVLRVPTLLKCGGISSVDSDLLGLLGYQGVA